ncbi:hypothetical protein Tco_0928454, partial [Tanacetum coccineum]
VGMKALLEQQGLAATFEELPAATIAAHVYVIWKKAFNALILCLVDQLYTFHMHPGKSQSDKLVGDLAAINTVISDEDQALLLLTSFPLSYDNFVETLLYGRDTLKLEDMLATLNSKELQKMTEAKGGGGEGLYSEEHLKRDCPRYNHKKSQGIVKSEDQVSGSGDDG